MIFEIHTFDTWLTGSNAYKCYQNITNADDSTKMPKQAMDGRNSDTPTDFAFLYVGHTSTLYPAPDWNKIEDFPILFNFFSQNRWKLFLILLLW